MRHAWFQAGDWVRVRTSEEVLSNLDSDGELRGLPFMPEMLSWCGKTYRVERRVERTCVDVTPPRPGNRRFPANDVVFLDGPRCDGSAHDGCRRACKIFWNENWLEPAASGEATAAAPPPDDFERHQRLKTRNDANRYLCQSTRLAAATEPFRRNGFLGRIRIISREVSSGNRTGREMVRFLAIASWQRALRALHGDEWLRGPHERAPTETLGLKPGDVVRVRSRTAMTATLDHNRGNRGLRVCSEMTRLCGGRAEVRNRVDRMIDERTGEMHELRDTVSLRNMHRQNWRGKLVAVDDSQCFCAKETCECPRGELMYWREIWLERSLSSGLVDDVACSD